MPDTSPAGTPDATGSNGLPVGPASPTAPVSKLTKESTTYGRTSRWLGLAALAIAICALGIAITAWFRPIHGPNNAHHEMPTPAFTAQQVADAKMKVCEAYVLVHQAVNINTNRQSPVPGDEIGRIAVAAHARLALYEGGSYLLERLSSEPATPIDLKDSLRSLADSMQEYSMNTLADALESKQNLFRSNIGNLIAEVDRLCK